jgi:hypothetical protein
MLLWNRNIYLLFTYYNVLIYILVQSSHLFPDLSNSCFLKGFLSITYIGQREQVLGAAAL